MAAFVVVSSLLELVEQQLLLPKPCLVLDDTETVVSLRDKLRLLQVFVERSELSWRNRHPRCGEIDPEVKEMLDTEIQDVATKAEGQIGSKLRLLYLAANANANGGDEEACQQLYQTMQQVLKDIKAVEVRILMLKPNFLSSSTNDFQGENIMVGVYSPSPSDLIPEDTPIIGLNPKAWEVVKMLIYKGSPLKRQVIAMCGLGGIGKTTLAKIVYEHREVRHYFHIRAWTVVSREHNVKDMLIHLLDCILPVTTGISNKGEAELAEQLRKSLVGKRYLIVLDDVWTVKAWDVIQLCFPNNFNGSRILITTRLREVCTYLSEQIFDVKSLSTEECWQIIKRKAFGNRGYTSVSYESYGRSFSRQCKGIPLAAVLIAGLLATTNNSLEIWGNISETLHRKKVINYKDVGLEAITSVCYDFLPNHLKACFLYFGIFPEDSSIPFTKLINLLVAEGFLKLERNRSLEEVAKSYLYDLINRNLVQIDKRSVDGKIKRCIIHDKVHEMCLREAKKKNIMSLLNEKHALEVCRWISC